MALVSVQSHKTRSTVNSKGWISLTLSPRARVMGFAQCKMETLVASSEQYVRLIAQDGQMGFL